MKLILFMLAILITGCQFQKEFSKTEKAKTEEKKDIETNISKEESSKTNDSSYVRKMIEIFSKVKRGDTVINNITTPVYNYYPEVRYTEESGKVSKTEDANKSDTSSKDKSIIKEDKTSEQDSKYKGGVLSLGSMIGLGILLLIIGYLFSKLKISLK